MILLLIQVFSLLLKQKIIAQYFLSYVQPSASFNSFSIATQASLQQLYLVLLRCLCKLLIYIQENLQMSSHIFKVIVDDLESNNIKKDNSNNLKGSSLTAKKHLPALYKFSQPRIEHS